MHRILDRGAIIINGLCLYGTIPYLRIKWRAAAFGRYNVIPAQPAQLLDAFPAEKLTVGPHQHLLHAARQLPADQLYEFCRLLAADRLARAQLACQIFPRLRYKAPYRPIPLASPCSGDYAQHGLPAALRTLSLRSYQYRYLSEIIGIPAPAGYS